MSTISDKNTRTNITISKNLKKQLEELATKDNRSFNNMVVTILEDYLKYPATIDSNIYFCQECKVPFKKEHGNQIYCPVCKKKYINIKMRNYRKSKKNSQEA